VEPLFLFNDCTKEHLGNGYNLQVAIYILYNMAGKLKGSVCRTFMHQNDYKCSQFNCS